MPAKLVKSGVVLTGIYKNKRVYEYGYTKEDHEPFRVAHKKMMDEYLEKCEKSPKFAATVPPPAINIPEVTMEEVMAFEEKHADHLVFSVKKHNGNWQFITDEKINKEEEVSEEEKRLSNMPKMYQCPKCKKEFYSEKGVKIHAANCDG